MRPKFYFDLLSLKCQTNGKSINNEFLVLFSYCLLLLLLPTISIINGKFLREKNNEVKKFPEINFFSSSICVT